MRNLSTYIDHTILKPTTSVTDIIKLCEEAAAHKFAAVGQAVQGADDLSLQLAGKAADAEYVIEAQRTSGVFDGIEQEPLVECFAFFHRVDGMGRR